MMDGAAAPVRTPWPDPPAPGAAVEVAEGVLWLRLPLPMALDHVNIYALDEGDGWTIVDAGLDTPESRAGWRAALAGPLAGKPVRRVLLTHYHPDHVGLAGWFMARHGAALWTTRTSWLMARMLILDVHDRPLPETLDFWRAGGMPEAELARRAARRPFNFADIAHPLPLGYRRIVEGQEITAGGRRWRVRMGAGHAPEMATLWSLDDRLVLGADQLLQRISPNIGVHASEPGADPLRDWFESCARLAAHASDDHLVLPGHDLPYTGLPARMAQLVGNHDGALDRLRAHLSRPRTAWDCFEVLFRREVGEGQAMLALAEAVAHLNHLHARGEVVSEPREDGAVLWRMAGAPGDG